MLASLSLVIPAYNEAAAIRAGKLRSAAEWSASRSFPVELILVDDGSLDETAQLAKGEADRVISIAHGGKAAAIMAGIRAAQHEIVLFCDMDQATPIAEADRLLAHLGDEADIVIGSRGMARSGAGFGRYLLSWGQVSLRGILLRLRLTDTQCGFKAFSREAANLILDHMHVYRPGATCAPSRASVTSGFDVEFLYVGRRLGYRIREQNVVWRYQETRRVHLLRDAWQGVADLLKIRAAALAGRYPRRSGPG